MSFAWTSEQRALRDRWVRFARRRLPASAKASTLVATLRETGLLTPDRLEAARAATIFDALAYAGVDSGALFMAQAHLWGAWAPLLLLRPDLAATMRNSPRGLLALAVTEEASGSDVYAMGTRARRVKGGWSLRGEKTFITNGPLAHAFLVLAKDDPGYSCFLVPAKARGLTRKKAPARLGLQTAEVSSVRFRDVHVPDGNLLGARGEGAQVFRVAMAWERSLILSTAAGRLERLVEQVERAAARRIRGGSPLLEAPAFRRALEETRGAAEGIRERIFRAAERLDSGDAALLESLETKVEASEAYERASRTLLRLGGKEAFYLGSELERNFRDSLAGSLYSGPNDLLRELLARARQTL